MPMGGDAVPPPWAPKKTRRHPRMPMVGRCRSDPHGPPRRHEDTPECPWWVDAVPNPMGPQEDTPECAGPMPFRPWHRPWWVDAVPTPMGPQEVTLECAGPMPFRPWHCPWRVDAVPTPMGPLNNSIIQMSILPNNESSESNRCSQTDAVPVWTLLRDLRTRDPQYARLGRRIPAMIRNGGIPPERFYISGFSLI